MIPWTNVPAQAWPNSFPNAQAHIVPLELKTRLCGNQIWELDRGCVVQMRKPIDQNDFFLETYKDSYSCFASKWDTKKSCGFIVIAPSRAAQLRIKAERKYLRYNAPTSQSSASCFSGGLFNLLWLISQWRFRCNWPEALAGICGFMSCFLFFLVPFAVFVVVPEPCACSRRKASSASTGPDINQQN